MSAGYSKTPLIKKLGIKAGFTIYFVNPPENLSSLLGTLPENTITLDKPAQPIDYVHLFTKNRQELKRIFPLLKEKLAKNGMFWVSWPKKASKVPTEVDEALVRSIGLKNGLVDVKICAVDDVWSGLKFVFRTKDRA